MTRIWLSHDEPEKDDLDAPDFQPLSDEDMALVFPELAPDPLEPYWNDEMFELGSQEEIMEELNRRREEAERKDKDMDIER